MRTLPHIGIQISDEFSQEFINKSKSELESDGLDIELRVYPANQVYLMLEWALPTAIVVFLLKSYFDGFLKEAGKDHYSLLKNWLKTKAETLKPIQVISIVPETSPEKIDVNNTQSKMFSIESMTRSGLRVKFLFDNNLKIEEWNIAIDNALNLLEKHHFNKTDDEITVAIEKQGLTGYQIFAIINSQTLQWEFLDFKTSHQRKIESKKKK